MTFYYGAHRAPGDIFQSNFWTNWAWFNFLTFTHRLAWKKDAMCNWLQHISMKKMPKTWKILKEEMVFSSFLYCKVYGLDENSISLCPWTMIVSLLFLIFVIILLSSFLHTYKKTTMAHKTIFNMPNHQNVKCEWMSIYSVIYSAFIILLLFIGVFFVCVCDHN